MKPERTIALVAVTIGALYLIWRLQEAKGGPVTFINPFRPSTEFLPGEPSPAGSEGSGTTNPLSQLFTVLGRAFKLPGNAPSVTALPSSPGTPVNPIGPPDTVTMTAQPERPAFVDDVEYLPNLGDPNFSSWNYLASTPPDLSWGLRDA